MNEINVRLEQDLIFLEDFVTRALDFGRAGMKATDPGQHVEVHVGGKSFLFAESEGCLRADLGKYLKANPLNAESLPDYSVFADYSSWYLDNGFGPPHKKFKSMSELNSALARIGVRGCYVSREQMWDLFDPESGFGVRLQCGPEGAPVWEETAPLARFCSYIAQQDNKLMLHAASVACNGVGALLVGAGGAGKSGTTLGALMGGLQSSGDDYTLLSSQAPYFAHAIHRTVKQDINGLKRLGLPTDFDLNWQNKAVFRPEDHVGCEIVDAVEVRAIIMPRRGANKSSLHEIPSTDVYKALAFSTFSQLGADPDTFFRHCSKLVRDLPCYRLDLSDDNDDVVGTLKKFLGTL